MNRLLETLALRPDLGRALRASIALTIPLLTAHVLGHRADAIFVALAAQTIALPDFRGAYGMRVVVLATMILVVSGSALLGVLVGGNIVAATLAMGALALIGGGWRHLSADYGPPLSVASALVFLLGLGQPGSFYAALHLAELVALGGLGGALSHVIAWPFRPQHPLRYAVAESWVAAADLVASLRPRLGEEMHDRGGANAEAERELRATLDRTFVILAAAEGRRPAAIIAHLEAMRREVVHLAMRVIALHGPLETLLRQPDFAREIPTVDSALKALGDATRSVAITLLTHRAINIAATEVRLQRAGHLLRVLEEKLVITDPEVALAQARAALGQIAQMLPRIRTALEKTIDREDADASYPARLPELSARSVGALAAWINPSPHLDPVLIRYALRMAALTMLAVALYKGFDIPRGYWIAFTVVVVLQPDYGSTRQRAAQRIGGTLAGSLLGSALLWIKLPVAVLDGCAGAMSFCFAYFLKRHYGVAVFFVTLMLVLLTETMGHIHFDFTLTRLLSNLAGGTLALISAVVFWPIWEGQKFTELLAAAVRANRVYFDSIAALLSGEKCGVDDLLMAKRRAENADRFAAASLQRLLAEPRQHAAEAARASALTTYIQRLTRAGTAIAVHLQDGAGLQDPALATAAREIGATLETLALAIETDAAKLAAFTASLERLEAHFARAPASAHPRSSAELIQTHLAKTTAELRAIALAL